MCDFEHEVLKYGEFMEVIKSLWLMEKFKSKKDKLKDYYSNHHNLNK